MIPQGNDKPFVQISRASCSVGGKQWKPLYQIFVGLKMQREKDRTRFQGKKECSGSRVEGGYVTNVSTAKYKIIYLTQRHNLK